MIQRLDGAVLVTGPGVDALRYAVAVAIRARRRNGLPTSGALAELLAACEPSDDGRSDDDGDDGGDDGVMEIKELSGKLRCSTRHARRLAPLLGGRRIGGVWLVDRQAVADHLEGATTG